MCRSASKRYSRINKGESNEFDSPFEATKVENQLPHASLFLKTRRYCNFLRTSLVFRSFVPLSYRPHRNVPHPLLRPRTIVGVVYTQTTCQLESARFLLVRPVTFDDRSKRLRRGTEFDLVQPLVEFAATDQFVVSA